MNARYVCGWNDLAHGILTWNEGGGNVLKWKSALEWALFCKDIAEKFPRSDYHRGCKECAEEYQRTGHIAKK